MSCPSLSLCVRACTDVCMSIYEFDCRLQIMNALASILKEIETLGKGSIGVKLQSSDELPNIFLQRCWGNGHISIHKC